MRARVEPRSVSRSAYPRGPGVEAVIVTAGVPAATWWQEYSRVGIFIAAVVYLAARGLRRV
jgi:hypothetical protein